MNSSQSGQIVGNLNTLTSSATGAQLRKINDHHSKLVQPTQMNDQMNHSYYTLSNNLSYSASIGGATHGHMY
jgi:hypothetical protein